jgi:hypothetical protein
MSCSYVRFTDYTTLYAQTLSDIREQYLNQDMYTQKAQQKSWMQYSTEVKIAVNLKWVKELVLTLPV